MDIKSAINPLLATPNNLKNTFNSDEGSIKNTSKSPPPWIKKRKLPESLKMFENLCSTPYSKRVVTSNHKHDSNINFQEYQTSDNHFESSQTPDGSFKRPNSLPKPIINRFFSPQNAVKKLSFGRGEAFGKSLCIPNSIYSATPEISSTFQCDSTDISNSSYLKKNRHKSQSLLPNSTIKYRITDPLSVMNRSAISIISLMFPDGEKEIKPKVVRDSTNSSPIVSNDSIQKIKSIGSGDSGATDLYKDLKTNEYFVLKKYFNNVKGDSDLAKLAKEAAALSLIDCVNVVKYFDSWVDSGLYFLKIEYCNGPTLREIISHYARANLTPEEGKVKLMFSQLLNGLSYIHEKGIIHMDFKPENILSHYQTHSLAASPIQNMIENSEKIIFKIVDFGHCFIKSGINIDVTEGDSRYISREVLKANFEVSFSDLKNLNQPDPSADIFSLALTVAQYCGCGELPPRGEMWHKIRNGNLPKISSSYSQDLIQILNSMIDPDPLKRPPASFCLELSYFK